MTNRSNILALLCVTAMLAPVACDDDEIDRRDAAAGRDGSVLAGRDGGLAGVGGGGAGGSVLDAGANADAANGPLTQAQAAGVVVEANAGEVEVGGLALSRSVTAQARSYAMMMVEEHSAAQGRLLALLSSIGIVPEESPVKDMLASMTQMTLAGLAPRTGATFDMAYLQSQVTMHTMVLALLDQRILPVVTNAQLRTELTAVRATVARHLAEAMQLLGTPDGGVDAAGGAGGGGAGGSVDAAVDAAADAA